MTCLFFQFGVIAADNAGQSASCTVLITIQRDQAPVFSGEPYYKEIQEKEPVNGPNPIFTVLAQDPDQVGNTIINLE